MHQKNGFELLNDYFDKIYVISIERNFDARHPKLKENLKGLNYEIFKGVDGSNLSKNEIEELYDDENAKLLFSEYCKFSFNSSVNRSFKLGEIGCSLSHLQVYHDMLSNKYKRILILEDDAKLMFQLGGIVSEIIKSIPSNADLIYWGYRWFDSESKMSRIKRIYFLTPIYFLINLIGLKKIDLHNERYPKPFNKYVWKSGYHCGSHAYSISDKTARLFIAKNTPVKYCADQLFSNLYMNGEINAYVCNPMVFREDQTMVSSIVS